jgi:hypothetical protein
MATVTKTYVIPLTMKESWDTYDEDYAEAIAKIKSSVKHKKNGSIVGEVVKFSVIGGWAPYIVLNESPLELGFIDIDDRLSLPDDAIAKLQLKDVQRLVDIRNKYLKQI